MLSSGFPSNLRSKYLGGCAISAGRLVSVCHEHSVDLRNYMKDEGKWLLEVALQEEILNHLKLLWSKAKVVSVKEKV
ncbi:hypothetical protein DB42_EA01270 [Neochlamydia sp. EPS4]|nr:hypothetical protein DB42_EA01270 [Neochlamydia sp. EPS4]